MPAVKKPHRHRRLNSTTVDFGRRVRALRLLRGWSYAELASLVYVTVEPEFRPSTLSDWLKRVEKGIRHPSLTEIRRLAECLGVSVEYLVLGR